VAETDPYQGIARILASSARGPWERVILTAESEPDWCKFEATIVRPGAPPTGLRLDEDDSLHGYFEQIQGIVKAIGGSRWKHFTLTLMRSGKFETEFRY
jgi:hypothetical protein